jgi:hypothetical protein
MPETAFVSDKTVDRYAVGSPRLKKLQQQARSAAQKGGRPKGGLTAMQNARQAAVMRALTIVRQWGIAPVDVLQAVMILDIGPAEEGKSGFTRMQFEAAVACAPYVHPKLAAIAYTPPPDPDAEKRRNMLAQLTYQERKELQAILEAARARGVMDIERVLDGKPAEPPPEVRAVVEAEIIEEC